jgi:MFS family permease
MRRLAPAHPWPLLFGTAALLFVVMVMSFTPTPLYPLYQQLWGISDGYIGLAFSAYPIGVVITLILLGGLSDRFGRRDTLLIATLLIAVALITMMFAGSYPLLLLGRFLQGIGAALAAGAGAATLMESHPGGLSRGALVNTLSVAGGSAVGPIMAGALADATPYPLVAPYLMVIIILIIPGVLLTKSKDVIPRKRDASLVRPIRLPRSIWLTFSIAAATVLGTNLCMGIYGSFGSNLAGTVGWTSEAYVGLLVSLVLLMLAVVQIFGRNLRPAVSMTAGLSSVCLGWTAVMTASLTAAAGLMVIGSMVVGAGAGLCLMGSAAYVGVISPDHRRAEIYSAYLVVAFSALGVTALSAGPIIGFASISTVVLGAGVLSAVLALYVGIGSRRWISRWT